MTATIIRGMPVVVILCAKVFGHRIGRVYDKDNDDVVTFRSPRVCNRERRHPGPCVDA